MEKGKSFLQTIKLEISKNFKLTPYERIAFHKILGILKSDTGSEILLKEINKGPDIRGSAISILVRFNKPEIISNLVLLLDQELSEPEIFYIFDYIEEYGNEKHINEIIKFIDIHKNDVKELNVISKAFNVLKKIANNSDQVLSYLLSIISNNENTLEVKSFAVIALSTFKVISTFEKLLKEGDDLISYSSYKSIYDLNLQITKSAKKESTEDSMLYTYAQENEDKIFLDIRVLLGKMSSKFDSYSNRTKVIYISAMITCNHREYQIYTMKALTSRDPELVYMTLHALYININNIRDPDKLFRNLIALTIENEIENDIIINIFGKYFTTSEPSRQFNILQDKLYSYIVVTLESYFETYRKEFMITDVIEKSFPENFQIIRSFILEKLNPDLKKKLTNFLQHDDSSSIRNIINEISACLKNVNEDEKKSLSLLIDILYDTDKKSRENSGTRIEDINFEKRYLKNRIIRLCKIIEKLNINDSASALVNIFNYLKKYNDPELTDITINTLSILNYSYMLGEIEVLITTGDTDDQLKALQLISNFTEQRSLNILLEFIKNKIDEESELLELAIKIIIKRDIKGNISANQIFKKIIEVNKNQQIINLTILAIGKCCIGADIELLDSLFYKMKDNETKDHIIRGIETISSSNATYDKRKVVRLLQEYLKDPGIKVRIYSCMLLVKLGFKDAIRSIRDMLIIKNKDIQREILNILGDLRSLEFSFFLVSLLREEYGLTEDIIEILKLLPDEELKEIDGFIVNIFRKFEAPDLKFDNENAETEIIKIHNLKKTTRTILIIKIPGINVLSDNLSMSELINLNIHIKENILSVIHTHNGYISKSSNNAVLAHFLDSRTAINVSFKIMKNINIFKKIKTFNKDFNVIIKLLTKNIKTIHDEIVTIPEHIIDEDYINILSNKLIVDSNTHELLKDNYSSIKLTEILFSYFSSLQNHYEILKPLNFFDISNEIINEKIKIEDEKDIINSQIEAELKKVKLKSMSTTSMAIARDLENVGEKINVLLKDIEKYVQKRSTDRELIKNVKKMTTNVYNHYKVEISRIIIE